jgi:hypothetical protein
MGRPKPRPRHVAIGSNHRSLRIGLARRLLLLCRLPLRHHPPPPPHRHPPPVHHRPQHPLTSSTLSHPDNPKINAVIINPSFDETAMPSSPPHRVAHTIPDFCHHLSSSAPSPLGRPMTEIDQAGALGSRRSDQPRRRFIILLPLVTSLTATWLAQASSIIDGPKLDGLMQQHFLGRSVWLLVVVVSFAWWLLREGDGMACAAGGASQGPRWSWRCLFSLGSPHLA